ncbi:MAG TPA: Sir2 family NAD-dependent protein deacetylase [Verrucomicrobiae bacterium]
MTIEQQLQLAVQAVADAQAVFITAGAGMGVDSGLPDFRGTEGFWRAYPAVAKLGLSFEQMANPEWFEKSPSLAWAFYGHRLELYRRTVPHGGFLQLLTLAAQKPGGYFVFTSNVDGQFQRAGFASERIVECHGSIHHFQCCQNCTNNIWDAAEETIEVDPDVFRAREPLPHCATCSGLARPNVLMFGDYHWLPHRTAVQEGNFSRWLCESAQHKRRLVVLEMGAGTAIPTTRYMSESVAAQFQCPLIRLNPREYNVPAGQIGLPWGAAEGIAKIYQQLTQ